MSAIFFILIGYLIGSISPAYFLGRLLKHVDIRQIGTKNAGTTNVYRELGLGAAILTAAFDLLKGLAAVWLAFSFQQTEMIAYGAGLAAIIGHIYPFYLRFRGGQGMATALGVLGFLWVKIFLSHSFFDLHNLISSLVTMVLMVGGIYYIARRGEVVGLFCIPAFGILLFLNYPISANIIFLAIILMIMWIVQIYNTVKNKVLDLAKTGSAFTHWRTILRPLAMLFPIAFFIFPKNIIFIILGSIAAFFIIFDLIRLPFNKFNLLLFTKAPMLLKEKDRHNFSSMTFFLTAIFILFLVFPSNIATIACAFVIFGDLGAKFFGMMFSRTHFLNRMVEGTMGYFLIALFFGFVVSFFWPVPFYIVILGALSAALTDAVSIFGLDDNFTVGLISASVMLAVTRLI